jgi:protein-tyrosine phosphatase
MNYLKEIGVTHVLNTAENHVHVNPAKYPLHGISYYGFHVDDHPSANISRYFSRTTDFIDEAVKKGGLIVVNCVMGW